MAKRSSLWILEKRLQFDTRVDVYVDGSGNESVMKWIPPFRACRALTAAAAAATPSNTVGDWFHPSNIQGGWVNGTDYEVVDMGGFWVDMYLCSSRDATRTSMGTVADGITVKNYVSQPGVAPRVTQTIAHFKQYLRTRFDTGGFAGGSGAGWSGKGGLITDQHWFEIWIWTRINRWLLHGNTAGYDGVNPSTPKWDKDLNEIGIRDNLQSAAYGVSITGGGPQEWDIPVSDFTGNRWEFTDGLRLFNGGIYSAGKKINPGGDAGGYSHVDYTNTLLSISGAVSAQSVASYRTEAALKLHGIAAGTTTAGQGGFDGAGFWFALTGETISLRGGASNIGVQCPGALYLGSLPSVFYWDMGARAVLVP